MARAALMALLLLTPLVAADVAGATPAAETPTPSGAPAATPPDGVDAPLDAPTTPQLSGGEEHTCGVHADGAVSCWGDNTAGQSMPPEGAFVAVAAGGRHTCGVLDDGSLSCWGDDTHGQATPPPGTFTAVTAGTNHTCAIANDATLDCWGDNTNGQATPPPGMFAAVAAGNRFSCAINADEIPTCWGDVPAGLDALPAWAAVGLTAGDRHGCMAFADASVECWGASDRGQTAPPRSGYVDVAAGWGFGCAVRFDNTVECFGDDFHDGIDAGQTSPPPGTFTQVTAGRLHACARATDGTVTCWGDNSSGQTDVPSLPGPVAEVRTAADLTCVLVWSVICWGSPISVSITPSGESLTRLAVGAGHACVRSYTLPISGSPWEDYWPKCDGPNSPGSYYYVDADDVAVGLWGDMCMVPLGGGSAECWLGEVPPTGSLASIHGGGDQICGLTPGNELRCWNPGSDELVTVPPGTYLDVDPGAGLVCAVGTDSSLQCWNGEQATVGPAFEVPATALPSEPQDVAVGAFHGELLVNWSPPADDGGLPVASYEATVEPGEASCSTQAPDTTCLIDGLDPATAVTVTVVATTAAGSSPPSAPFGPLTPSGEPLLPQVDGGDQHTCALLADGTATCWGDNSQNQLDAPAGSYVKLTVGSNHACALTAAGSVDCWGGEDHGDFDVPVGPFNRIDADGSVTCGVRTDWTAVCWGPGAYTPNPAAGVRQVFPNTGCVLERLGTVQCPGVWYGYDDSYYPPTVPVLRGDNTSFGNESVACALTIGRDVACWGYISEPALATAHVQDRTGDYRTVGRSGMVSCAITATDNLECWAQWDELEWVNPAILEVPDGAFSWVGGGRDHLCAVRLDDTITCWGNNSAGQATSPFDYDPPDPPTAVTVDAGATTLDIGWTPPASDGGTPITSYTATATPGNHTCTTTPPDTTCTIDGLTNGTTYTVTVTATTTVGTSEPSNPADATPTVCGTGDTGPFTDVGDDHLFCTQIEWLVASGIATGYDDGTFRPTVAVSRQAMAAFLWRRAGEPTPSIDEQFFADVDAAHAFYEPIQWMAGEGLSTGTAQADGQPLFKPTEAVSRQATAAFLHRVAVGADGGEPAEACSPGSEGPFSDVSAAHPFCEAIAWLADEGIASGYDDGTFRPTVAVSRQAMASFLAKAS
ncbi:MAG: S-layer homology domain-containing protein [Acidimicrobiia bacterium]|nr:S-layer homology domain-containing protein [Acidimicrobiia bacterium]